MDFEPCIFCGGRLALEIASLADNRFGAAGEFAIAGCASCGLEMTQPRPSEADLERLYDRHYGSGAGTDERLYRRLREAFFASPLYGLWIALDGDFSFHGVAARRPGLRLLDVGCHEGRGLALYRASGFAVEGLEPNGAAAARARARGFTVHGRRLEAFEPAAPYDVVVLANVLEHARDPAAMLAEASRLLADGGELWVSCPNNRSWLRALFGRHWINWHVPYHLVHFSRRSLERVLGRAGFEVFAAGQATPALWVTQSIIAALFARPGRPTAALRRPFLVMALMILARGLGFPTLWLGNRLGRGDCLVARARRATR